MIAISRAPRRLFFVAGGLQVLLASAWWGWALVARMRGVAPPLAEGIDPLRVHALLMLYGFFPLLAFGFLLTAAPRWLRVAPHARRDYLMPAILAIASSLAIFPALFIGAAAVGYAMFGLLVAWLWILARVIPMIAASRVPDRLHVVAAVVAMGGGAVGTGAAVIDMAGIWNGAADAMRTLGLWAFLVPFFFTMSQRTLPARTHRLTLLWLAFAVALFALQALLRALGYVSLGLAPTHALGVGYLASVTLLMASRVSRGHDAPRITHDRFAWHAFLLLQCAAVARVAADLWLAHYAALLLGAGMLWLAAFAAWSWRYLPNSWQSRHHGRPG